ncbi:alpha/beta hydrolase [Agrilactobacillus fermenti]|uniref:alpha/beta hydrolase n=1 Tax=Agrilactobacillus fermenti TaxID=2586909 RepID=UPI001E3C4D16|nr:alpha/beta fold hydrolase [Agrilactobacillus fermenti]MCD2256876.1 alpha/beta fold hydrolase [Agrilactobacillus fermenti]
MQYKMPQPLYYDAGKVGIVLLHAYSGTSSDHHMLGRFLEGAGYSVYIPHFTGHATFEPLDILEQGSAEQWWTDTKAAIRYIAYKHKQPIYVFGLSMGGIFATKAIMTLDAVVAGGVFSSPVIPQPENNVYPNFLKYARQIYRYAKIKPTEIETKMARIETLLPKQLADVHAFAREMVSDLGTITKPFFIGQSGQDEMIDAQGAYQLRAALKQATVDFHWYENASHVLTVGPAHKQLQLDVLHFIQKTNEEVAN